MAFLINGFVFINRKTRLLLCHKVEPGFVIGFKPKGKVSFRKKNAAGQNNEHMQGTMPELKLLKSEYDQV